MKKHLMLASAVLFSLSALSLSAADLTIEMQVNVLAKDYANSFLTFKGLVNSVEKDQFAPSVDATSGASKLSSTELFNAYRFDVKGKPTLPAGLRSLLLYAVADDSVRVATVLNVTKASDGVIVARYINRGLAYEIITDGSGKIPLPTTAVKTRRTGSSDNLIHADFSSTGRAADVDWMKVWDTRIKEGKAMGNTTAKTGPVAADVAASEIYFWTGVFQFAFDGRILKINAALDARGK